MGDNSADLVQVKQEIPDEDSEDNGKNGEENRTRDNESGTAGDGDPYLKNEEIASLRPRRSRGPASYNERKLQLEYEV